MYGNNIGFILPNRRKVYKKFMLLVAEGDQLNNEKTRKWKHPVKRNKK